MEGRLKFLLSLVFTFKHIFQNVFKKSIFLTTKWSHIRHHLHLWNLYWSYVVKEMVFLEQCFLLDKPYWWQLNDYNGHWYSFLEMENSVGDSWMGRTWKRSLFEFGTLFIWFFKSAEQKFRKYHYLWISNCAHFLKN